ncbi:MAG: hypothetical protein ACLQQ4_18460 [Bacteroidia bacterium]
MKTIYTFLAALLLNSMCVAQSGANVTIIPDKPATTDSISLTLKPTCPPEGKTLSNITERVNIMKNRDIKEGTVNPNIVIDSILKGMPEDTGRYSPSDFATVTGYVLDVDDAGAESCNCFSWDDSKHNIILYIGHSIYSGKDSVFVVEITAKYRAAHPEFNTDGLFGKKVTLSGYMMYNFDMKKMALNAYKRSHATNRKTAWEICPVTDITVFQGQSQRFGFQ